MKSFKTALKIVGFSLVVLAIAGSFYQRDASKKDEKSHEPVGRMIDVGGYKLHMIDSNVGAATVVIDSGLGLKTLDWCLVQPEIAKFARVITYDRAGYGWSDASPLARTSENMVEEMHAMLHNAKIPAPYILVGHAFGGMNVRLFASRYPDEVAGVILVDAGHEDLFDKLPQLRPSALYVWLVEAASYVGFFRLLDLLPSQQKKMHHAIAKYPIYLQRMYGSQTLTTKYIDAMMQESLHQEESYKQIKAAGSSLGDKPLTVISADKPFSKGLKTSAKNNALDKTWLQLQADLVTKSSRGKQIMTSSGHNIPCDQPRVIIDAVQQMVINLKPAQ